MIITPTNVLRRAALNTEIGMRYSRHLATLLVACCAGCSFPQKFQNSLCGESEVVCDDVLLGTWSGRFLPDKPLSVRIQRQGGDRYVVSGEWDDQVLKPSEARLFHIGQHLFVDIEIRPEKGEPFHYFFRLALHDSRLFLRFIDQERLARLLEKNPAVLKHVVLERPKPADPTKPIDPPPVFITANTADLRTFVRQQLTRNALWGFSALEPDRDIPVGESGLSSKKSRTFNFWYALMDTNPFHEVSELNNGSLPEDPERWGRLADSINSLPTIGVDLDAATCAREMAGLCREIGEIYQRTAARAWVTEAIARSLAGDPIGALGDRLGAVAQRVQDVNAKMREVRERLEEVRVVLTDRYEVEFPRIQ